MTTIRNTKANAPAANTKSATAPIAPEQAQQPKVQTDSLKVSKPDATPGGEALRYLNEASQLPPMPSDAAGQRAWLMDGFARLLKMSAAEKTLQEGWRDGKIDGKTLSVARSRSWTVERELEKAPGHAEAKKEFFSGVIKEASNMLDGLAGYPAAPADKAGKKAWLEKAKGELARAKEAERIMKDCWFEHKVLSFEEMSKAGDKVWEFEGKIRRVDHELNPPPKPKPGQRPAPGGPGRPLFELTQAAQKGLDSKNPIGQTAGAIAMPIALTIDLIDMFTRPLQWLESTQQPPAKKK